jgi:hypothetical protein
MREIEKPHRYVGLGHKKGNVVITVACAGELQTA